MSPEVLLIVGVNTVEVSTVAVVAVVMERRRKKRLLPLQQLLLLLQVGLYLLPLPRNSSSSHCIKSNFDLKLHHPARFFFHRTREMQVSRVQKAPRARRVIQAPDPCQENSSHNHQLKHNNHHLHWKYNQQILYHPLQSPRNLP